MAAQRAARLRPRHLQLVDVVFIDIAERAVALEAIIAARYRPQIWVFLALNDILIGETGTRQSDKPNHSSCQ